MKILVQLKSMNPGGIESALATFVKSIRQKIDIDVLLFNKGGEFLNRIPKDVNVFESNKLLKKLNPVYNYSSEEKNHFLESNKKKSKFKAFIKKLGVRSLIERLSIWNFDIKTNYDCAIAFQGLDLVACKCILKIKNAKKKFAVIHSDVSMVNISSKQLKVLFKFDKILCVSKSCRDTFLQRYPQFINKVDFMYNFCDVETILEQSKEITVDYSHELANLISVSRISPEKGHERMLSVLCKLKEEGYDFIWHVLGDGICKVTLEKEIYKYNMDSCVKLYGNKNNPYPYIKAADLFLLPSFHEAAPMVFGEAMVLKTPIITTNTCSARELVGDWGFICDNSEDDLYNILKTVLSDQNIIKAKKSELKNYCYPNEYTMNKVLELIGSDNGVR